MLTVGSWEPRFMLGFERLIAAHSPREVLMYYYSEYSENSKSNRVKARELCNKQNIGLEEHELSFARPIASWKALYNTAGSSRLAGQGVIIDITTMPREAIWILFGFLTESMASVLWAYHKPAHYNSEWLSRDPDRPRLVPKMGGVAKLGYPTKLLLLTGFDVERTRQLLAVFEPEFTWIGVQTGDQFNNRVLNIAKNMKEFQGSPATKLFEVDAYCADQGRTTIEQEISEHLKDSNVIMASLGPKVSAVALYHIHKANAETSLVYAPSREFNVDYSYGIGETFYGEL